MKTVTAFMIGLLLPLAGIASAQTSKDLFKELQEAGGIHPLASLVCFPNSGQEGQEGVFTLVGFSASFAEAMRSKGKPVSREFLDAEKAVEKDRFIMLWLFRNGVPVQKDPEILDAVVGSSGQMRSTPRFSPPDKKLTNKFVLRMVFGLSGPYSRDVLVDGTVTASVYGKCEPVQ